MKIPVNMHTPGVDTCPECNSLIVKDDHHGWLDVHIDAAWHADTDRRHEHQPGAADMLPRWCRTPSGIHQYFRTQDAQDANRASGAYRRHADRYLTYAIDGSSLGEPYTEAEARQIVEAYARTITGWEFRCDVVGDDSGPYNPVTGDAKPGSATPTEAP